ncbi:MAG: hypothetical protein U9Q77_04280 [Candidatus Marinimicrobia bacterium]|nr:hypothetical protein [Candidatus Neomarinimicrobiota bacterium]
MLRSEIDNSINKLIRSIEECELVEVFTAILENEGETNPTVALHSFSKFLEITQSYNAFEHKLLKMFELEKLKDTAFWAAILKPDGQDLKRDIEKVCASIRFTLDYLPKVLSLTGENLEKITSTAVEEGKKSGLQYVRLSVVVIEEQELSSPKRLILMLEAIQGLYEVVGRIKNLPVRDLIVTACDSGNDKKFDFLGSSEAIEGVKAIILSLWDGIMFYRDDKTGKQIELIAQSLPVLDEINDLEKTGAFGQEEAEILRRRTILSVNKFSQAGVTIPEMEDFTRYDPRELMRPDQKILTASSELETSSEQEKFAEQVESPEPAARVESDGFAEQVDQPEPVASVKPEESVELDDFTAPAAPTQPEQSLELVDFTESDETDELVDFAKPETSAQSDEAAELVDFTEPADSPEQEEATESDDSPESTPESTKEKQSIAPVESDSDEDSIFKRMAAGYLEANRKTTKK